MVDDAVCDAGVVLASLRGDRVEFIEENNARGSGLRLFKNFSNLLLALAYIFSEDLGALDSDAVQVLRGDDCGHDVGLTAARWSEQQHAASCFKRKFGKELWVL